jgi:hypothetical protein
MRGKIDRGSLGVTEMTNRCESFVGKLEGKRTL